jgi:hypothetical protein
MDLDEVEAIGALKAKPLGEMLEHLADFKQYLHVESRPAGWYPAAAR